MDHPQQEPIRPTGAMLRAYETISALIGVGLVCLVALVGSGAL